jgi:hypothetical protein
MLPFPHPLPGLVQAGLLSQIIEQLRPHHVPGLPHGEVESPAHRARWPAPPEPPHPRNRPNRRPWSRDSSLAPEFYSKQADAFATLRDVSGCTAATSKARTHIQYLGADDDLPYLYWVTPVEIAAYAGQRLLQLGHAGQETALLDDGIALFDESSTRNRQVYLMHLADALTRPGKQRDFDNAATRGMETIDIAESLHSTYSLNLLSDLYQRMKPHTKVPAV